MKEIKESCQYVKKMAEVETFITHNSDLKSATKSIIYISKSIIFVLTSKLDKVMGFCLLYSRAKKKK
jgi:hypothetical protein